MTKNPQILRASLIFTAVVSIMIVGVQPIFIGLLVERLALTLSQQGWVISIEMAGMALGTLLTPPLAKRFSGRNLCLVTVLVNVLCNLLSAHADSLSLLMLSRLASGTCAGLLYAYAVCGIGRLPGQDRSFGFMLLLQTPIYSLYAAALPVIAAVQSVEIALYTFAGWALLIGVVCLNIPKNLDVLAQSDSSPEARSGCAIIGRFSLVGMLFLQVAIYCVWGFIDQMGRDRGISAVDIGWAFGVGTVGGLPGALLPSVLGARVQRGLMIAIGSLAVLVATGLLTGYSRDANELLVAITLLNFGWVLALSYYMSSVTTNDPNGNLTPLVSITLMVAAALTPALIALLMQETDRPLIFLVASSALIVGLIFKWVGTVYSRRVLSRLSI